MDGRGDDAVAERVTTCAFRDDFDPDAFLSGEGTNASADAQRNAATRTAAHGRRAKAMANVPRAGRCFLFTARIFE